MMPVRCGILWPLASIQQAANGLHRLRGRLILRAAFAGRSPLGWTVAAGGE